MSVQTRVGDVLVMMGKLTQEDHVRARAEQERREAEGNKVPMGQILLEMDLTTQEDLDVALKKQGGLRSEKRLATMHEMVMEASREVLKTA